MNREILVGLIIALILTCVGAYWITSQGNGDGGFLLDFLRSSNTTVEGNLTSNNTYLNETNSTINNTVNNTPADNSTITTLQFLTTTVFDNSTDTALISVNASENITVDSMVLFTSYNNINFSEIETYTNVSLPTVLTIPVNTSYSILYYYLEILYNNMTFRIPENSSEALNITIQE